MQPPCACTLLSEIIEGLSEHIRESQVRFLVRRECVLEDTLCTVQWRNFSEYNRVVVSFSFCMLFKISVVYCFSFA